MKTFFAVIIFAFSFILTGSSIFAQTEQPQQAPKIIKPQVFAMDLLFAYQLLNTIELRGNEVDALLEIKNVLKPYIEKIQKDNVALNNQVTFDISAAVAYNLIQFLERGKFTGADAEKYKRFIDAFNEAAKAVKPNSK